MPRVYWRSPPRRCPMPPWAPTTPSSFPPWGEFRTGLQIDAASGAITGKPTQFGAFQPTFTVTDQTPQTVVKQIALTVNAAGSLVLSPATLPDATAGTNYSEQLSAVGGVAPYFFTATGLLAGLQLNANNQIVGQCTAGSVSNQVMLKVSDSAAPPVNTSSVGPLTVHCNAAPSITSTSPLANGIVNKPYTAAIQMSGGTAPIAWSLTPGTLPAGFNLSNAGVLAGTATAPVSPQFSVTVTEPWGASVNKPFTLTFYAALSITTSSLPAGVQGSPYPNGTTLAVTGGTGNGTYQFSAIGLPTGLQIDAASGAITGKPTQFGAFQPTFTVTDQTPQTVMKQIGLTVTAAGSLVLSPAALPDATAGTN